MKFNKSILGIAVLGVFAFVLQATSVTTNAKADTLEDVQSRGNLSCIISTGLTGFAFKDNRGRWVGFDVGFCRAISAAIFNDPDRVRYVPSSTKTRFTLLTSGEGDILSRNTTWTLSRDADLGLAFTVTTYYDGQGFMVPRSLGVTDAKQLDGASVCVQSGTTTELNLSDFFRINNISYESVSIETNEEALVAYQAGRCDAYTTDRSGLAASRASTTNPGSHIILPNVISKEPLAVAVREGDDIWADIVRWVIYGLIEAEELGVNSGNVDEMVRNQGGDSPSVRRLLGFEGTLGQMLGLDNDFMVRAIRSVGNYGEVYNRHLTPIGLERGINDIWTQGGLHFAPPFR